MARFNTSVKALLECVSLLPLFLDPVSLSCYCNPVRSRHAKSCGGSWLGFNFTLLDETCAALRHRRNPHSSEKFNLATLLSFVNPIEIISAKFGNFARSR